MDPCKLGIVLTCHMYRKNTKEKCFHFFTLLLCKCTLRCHKSEIKPSKVATARTIHNPSLPVQSTTFPYYLLLEFNRWTFSLFAVSVVICMSAGAVFQWGRVRPDWLGGGVMLAWCAKPINRIKGRKKKSS